MLDNFPKCRIFSLMVIKNFRKQKQHKLTLLTSMITPVIFSFVIIVLQFAPDRSDSENEVTPSKAIQYQLWWQTLVEKINMRRAQMIIEREAFQSNVFVPKITLGYAPNTTAGIRKLIEGVMRDISMTPVQISSFQDCEELRIRAATEQYIASVCFHNVDESQRGLPLKLHFSILMPSELRLYEDSWIGDNWKVNYIFDTQPINSIDTETSSISSYVREGFISLQYYISIGYLHIASGNAKIPEVLLRPYELNSNVSDLILEGVDTSVLVLLIGFMFPVTMLTKEIVEERELGLHFAFNTNNPGSRLQFVAWFFNGFCLLLITCVIFTLVLKIEWHGSSSVFNKCPWYIMLIFFTSYVISAVAFSILMAVIMRTTKMVVAMVPIYWILISLPLLSGQSLESTWANGPFILASFLLCNVTMCRGLRRILCFERYVGKLNVKQYLISTVMGKDPTLLMFIGMFYIQTFLYVLLAMLLDGNVSPCLLKLIKCTPLRHMLTRLRRRIRRKQREKQQKIEDEAELKESISDITERTERLTKSVNLYEEHVSQMLATRMAPQSERSLFKMENNNVIDNSSSSSSSEPEDAQQDMLDQQRLVWLSKHELGNKDEQQGEQQQQQKKRPTKFLLRSSNMANKPLDSGDESDGNDVKIDETTRPIVIEFKNIWKKYHKTFVVRKFSLKVYQNEIMVLLGHNASGKTTLLNMACGKLAPSSGKIFIDGNDVFLRPTQAYKNVGMSLHNLHLFIEFTFFEHLVFFCRLRGLNLHQSQDDINSYLRSFQVEELATTPVNLLTTGQSRLLQMLCAFAGRTQIVLLDKPMEGIDSQKRHLFYKFALAEGHNRTIFITTNFPNVASNLGDRIGILVNGSLYACGREKFLLKLDTNIYRLICYLGRQCDFSKLFNYFAYYIPSMELESRMGDSAVFKIDYFDLDKLMKLLQMLSKKRKDLHVDSYQIMTTSLEHILLKAMTHKHVKNMAFVNATLSSLTTHIRHIEESQRSTKRSQLFADICRLFIHIEVVLRKRFVMDIRSNMMPMLQIFLPSLLCIWTLCMPQLQHERTDLHTNAFTMNYYENTVMLLQKKAATIDAVLAASSHYMDYATFGQRIIDVNENEQILEYMNWYMAENYIITDLNFVVAAIFNDETVEALYNNNLMHSAPLSLTLMMEALAVGFVNPTAEISVKLELLPYSTLHTVLLDEGIACVDFVFYLTTSFCFCFVWALPLLNFGLGRGTPYGRLELVAGMRYGTVSTANFIYGMLKVVISLLPLNAFILLFHNAMSMNAYDNYTFVYVVLVVGLYVTSIDILVSYWITEMRLGYIVIVTFYLMGIVIYLSSNELKSAQIYAFDDIVAFSFHPYYALVHNLMYMNNISEIREVCADMQTYETSVYLEQCQIAPNCCDNITPDYLLLDIMWSSYVAILLIWAFLYARLSHVNVSKLKRDNNTHEMNQDSDPDNRFDQSVLHFTNQNETDNTWINEKIRVRTLESPYIRTKALHVENLGVFLRTNVVLNHINFLIERHQVMSIAGVNGSGKTVLIKTFLGTIPYSTGSVSSYGKHTYQYREQENFKHIGYCAQDDEIKDALTVVEVIQTVLRIRGLKKAKVLSEAQTLLRIFDLYNSRFQLVTNCSRGTRKRLSIAISLIGYAGLILMDDPFAYLDVSGRRNIYSIIETQCNTGQAVLFTSSDPQPCDLANRTAMINRPSLCVIGERQELQLNHYATYIVVSTRVKIDVFMGRLVDMDEDRSDPTKVENMKYLEIWSIIENIFPNAIIKINSNQSACFWLSSRTYSMSNILETLHKNKNIFYSFEISSPSLDSIFSSILKQPHRTIEIIEDEDM